MTITWSPLAVQRLRDIGLRDIATYIARDDREAAKRWAAQVFDRVEQLADFPESGRIVPEIGRRDLRELILGHYRIIYRVHEDSVNVLSVHSGRRPLGSDDIA